MHYFIKNMVCNRCIMVVQQVFEEEGNPPVRIVLGEVETLHPLTQDHLGRLKSKLVGYGFEMIDDTRSQLIEKIKSSIIGMVRKNDGDIKMNHSSYIESILHRDYAYLSALFSEVEGTTIEKYIILQKIERVKELLVYDELTLSEIAVQTGYSNVAYLSGQFKKITGLTPSHFKKVRENKRIPLDQL